MQERSQWHQCFPSPNPGRGSNGFIGVALTFIYFKWRWFKAIDRWAPGACSLQRPPSRQVALRALAAFSPKHGNYSKHGWHLTDSTGTREKGERGVGRGRWGWMNANGMLSLFTGLGRRPSAISLGQRAEGLFWWIIDGLCSTCHRSFPPSANAPLQR